MDELMEFIIPTGKDFQLVDPSEHDYWIMRKSRNLVLDWELGDDYRTVELIKTIISFNLAEKDIPVEELKPLVLWVFSFGGDSFQCSALCDVIEASRIPIITVCMGVAMSSGFLIFLAGKRRYAFSQAQFLVHDGYLSLQGTADQVDSAQKNYKKSLDKMKAYVLSHTKIDDKLFSKYKSKDWYIEGPEIESLGIAKVVKSFDEIV